MEKLVSFIVFRSENILAELPSAPPHASKVQTGLYKTRLEKLLLNEVDSACSPTGVTDKGSLGKCHVTETGLRWIEARSLARNAIEQKNEVINP